MSFGETLILGAVAGLTIFLGLPFARIRAGGIGVRTLLSGVSAGILVFLLFDILGHATEPVEKALTDGAWGQLALLAVVYVAGLGLGLLGLLYAQRWTGALQQGVDPGAIALKERAEGGDARRLGMVIATGIGLHNFSEGLVIGQSAASGAVSLALLLIIGFALHNATEGFGIVGPLVAIGVRPTWRWLAVAGLIGGGPTFLGTLIGTAVSSPVLFVAFLALAAGAILYVVGELLVAGRRASWEMTLWGVFLGFLFGLASDLILVAAGG